MAFSFTVGDFISILFLIRARTQRLRGCVHWRVGLKRGTRPSNSLDMNSLLHANVLQRQKEKKKIAIFYVCFILLKYSRCDGGKWRFTGRGKGERRVNLLSQQRLSVSLCYSLEGGGGSSGGGVHSAQLHVLQLSHCSHLLQLERQDCGSCRHSSQRHDNMRNCPQSRFRSARPRACACVWSALTVALTSPNAISSD